MRVNFKRLSWVEVLTKIFTLYGNSMREEKTVSYNFPLTTDFSPFDYIYIYVFAKKQPTKLWAVVETWLGMGKLDILYGKSVGSHFLKIVS